MSLAELNRIEPKRDETRRDGAILYSVFVDYAVLFGVLRCT